MLVEAIITVNCLIICIDMCFRKDTLETNILIPHLDLNGFWQIVSKDKIKRDKRGGRTSVILSVIKIIFLNDKIKNYNSMLLLLHILML